MPSENTLAVFIDFENLALGFDGRRNAKFDIQMVLGRLVEKGKIIVKRAYADWGRFREYRTGLHEAAIELIEIPRRAMTGKNSADIRLVVDAMDLSYSKEHVGTFVIISGDSDFSPLVSKLKENGKHVIGLGMKTSTSDLLIDNCDEFIFYEDLERPVDAPVNVDLTNVPSEKKKVMTLVMDAMAALRRENKEMIWSSMVKDTIKRKKPQFNESYYGYRTFSSLLEDAQRLGMIALTTDSRSGTYVVNEAGARPTGGATNGYDRDRDRGRDRDRDRDRDSRRDESYRSERSERSEGRTEPAAAAPTEGGAAPAPYSREERWGRRRGRRGRWDERNRDGAGGNYGSTAAAAASGYGDGSATHSESRVIDESIPPQDQEPSVVYDAAPLSVPADATSAEPTPYGEAPSDPGASARDEYGFPLFAGTGAMDRVEDTDRTLDEDGFTAEPASPPAPDPFDDRTPEERELDARAARLAHSLETTASPSVAKKGGTRRGTRATTAAPRGRGGRAAAPDAPAAEPRPRARRAGTGAASSGAGRSGAGRSSSGSATTPGGRPRGGAPRAGGARRGTRKSG